MTQTLDFASVSRSDAHAVGVTRDGVAFTWATAPRGARFGQLGRGARADPRAARVRAPASARGFVAAWAGGAKDSGHTALLDASGALWMCGCDRWLQVGLLLLLLHLILLLNNTTNI